MKKFIKLFLLTMIIISTLVGCSKSSNHFNKDSDISVVSREDGSGTRGAFIELFGIEEKDSAGNKTDKTTGEAIIVNKTDVMMTNIKSDMYAIGYVSLGSLNNSIKALNVDGVEATIANIKNETYAISRPFNIAIKQNASELAKDFIEFILSAEGQAVIEDNGYISVIDNPKAFNGKKPTGKIVVGGSSSVTPVMEKLKEAYAKQNLNATIEIQMTDSSAGMKGAIDATYDIGMASRELKDSERAELEGIVIALDGIAVIVNNDNPLTNITSQQVKSIFTGEVTNWEEIIK